MVYFTDNSRCKEFEVSKSSWGEMTDDFMFRQCDFKEFKGVKISQKHMYAYAMFDNHPYLSLRLSKTNFS
ncbi:MAG: hypothetical protein IIA45_04975 [Bacteroidetes bacterium]|nr:hypothetical protein [Bacteroidota bacterium]